MNIAIILAGGKGTRMGNVDTPKQFIEVYGKPIVIHTLEMFDIHPEIDGICLVCLDDWHEEMRRWIRKYELNKVKWIVSAGSTRQESVYNGLIALQEIMKDDDIVVIHDSARPLITPKIISDNIKLTEIYGSVDTVIASSDTVVRSADGMYITEIPKRSELFLGQTPQSFKYSIIYSAHVNAMKMGILDATDDCQLVIKNGNKVALVNGDKLNFKITTMEDLLVLKSIIKMSKLEWI